MRVPGRLVMSSRLPFCQGWSPKPRARAIALCCSKISRSARISSSTSRLIRSPLALSRCSTSSSTASGNSRPRKAPLSRVDARAEGYELNRHVRTRCYLCRPANLTAHDNRPSYRTPDYCLVQDEEQQGRIGSVQRLLAPHPDLDQSSLTPLVSLVELVNHSAGVFLVSARPGFTRVRSSF